MKKLDIKGIFTRPRKLLLHPEIGMAGDRSGEHRGNRTFQEFPCASVRTFFCMCNIATFVINLTSLRHWNRHHPVHGLRRGSYIAYRVTREYLSNKVAEANRMAPSPCRVQLGRLHPVPLPFQWILGRIYIPTHGNM